MKLRGLALLGLAVLAAGYAAYAYVARGHDVFEFTEQFYGVRLPQGSVVQIDKSFSTVFPDSGSELQVIDLPTDDLSLTLDICDSDADGWEPNGAGPYFDPGPYIDATKPYCIVHRYDRGIWKVMARQGHKLVLKAWW